MFALLIPIGVLFAQAWQGQSSRMSFAASERHGIEYLTTLSQVTTALTDAQSAAVAGRAVDRTALARAVDTASAVDNRLGDELRTRERWSGLRVKIEALPTATTTDPETVYSAYSEATDLLLALYAKVRENSQLLQDPEGDTYFLQDGASEELPEAVVAAGRFVDIVVIQTKDQHQDHREEAAASIAAARQGLLDPASDLADGLQNAVDSTQSRTMGGNLLSRLDRFRRSMDTLAASVSDQTLPSADKLAAPRTEVQTAASDLSTTILAELDVLIEQRQDGVWTERLISIGTLVIAVLGTCLPLLLALSRRRRRRPPFHGPSHASHVAATPDTVPSQWEPAGAAR
ncbi:hypothetical protein Prum_053090 [Phytohabitans rumicis]|uniref:Uncharacterized protein n=1 Tax=Phytohabitans rumicis TaxID=1076125 RepID=A0A6V8LC90_9ACTN|nr:hypothetical protein Prum_053090 [Phytohabitans rumicis]